MKSPVFMVAAVSPRRLDHSHAAQNIPGSCRPLLSVVYCAVFIGLGHGIKIRFPLQNTFQITARILRLSVLQGGLQYAAPCLTPA